MFIGRGKLGQVMEELTRQRDSKIDVVLDGRTIGVQTGASGLVLAPVSAQAGEWLGQGVEIKTEALKQLGGRLSPEVPSRFLTDLAEQRGQLAAELLSGLLQAPKRHFVRMLDGKVRAFLSDRYRVVDNYDVAFAALGAVREVDGEALEARLSDSSLHLTFTDRRKIEAIDGVVKTGGRGNQRFQDIVRGGDGGELVSPYVSVSNSETGRGGFNVKVGLLRLACVNGAIVESLHNQIHLGETLEVGKWSEETRSAEGRAIILKCQDAIRQAFHPDTFKRMIAIANRAQADRIDAPTAAVDNLIANTELPEAARDSILSYFLQDYDSTRYGLSQAVSRYSQDTDDAEAASDIEVLAGRLLKGEFAVA